MRKGDRGAAVEAWQGTVSATADGIFGAGTERKTKVWQAVEAFEPTGVVGQPSLMRAYGDPWGASSVKLAKHFRARPRSATNWVVIHTAETPEKANSAEGIANYFTNPIQRRRERLVEVKASAHFAVDADSLVVCVPAGLEGWHVRAPGVNAASVGIEIAGRAAQTPEQWSDAYSLAAVYRAGALVAKLCREFGVPLQRVDANGLRDGRSGVAGHVDFGQAFGRDTHTDPGKHFPWDRLMAAAEGSCAA